jgi:hypothetical protein
LFTWLPGYTCRAGFCWALEEGGVCWPWQLSIVTGCRGTRFLCPRVAGEVPNMCVISLKLVWWSWNLAYHWAEILLEHIWDNSGKKWQLSHSQTWDTKKLYLSSQRGGFGLFNWPTWLWVGQEF